MLKYNFSFQTIFLDPDQNHVQERDLGTDEKIKDHLDPDLNLESENAVVDEKGNNVKESEETEKEKKENGNENVRKNVNVEKRNDVGKENGKENVCVKESDEKENIGTEKEEIERKKKEQTRNGKIVKSARHPANHPLLKVFFHDSSILKINLRQKEPWIDSISIKLFVTFRCISRPKCSQEESSRKIQVKERIHWRQF